MANSVPTTRGTPSPSAEDLAILDELAAMEEAAKGGDREKEEREELRRRHRILSTSQYDRPKYTAYKDGIGFAPKGNIIMLSAEKKHGKTFVFAQMAALMVGAMIPTAGCYWLNGLQRMGEPYKIAYFDTEMDRYDSQLTLKRILHMSGTPAEDESTRVHFYNIREMGAEERARFVISESAEVGADVVFIDGVRDLLHDFNDIDESNDLVNRLMKMSSAQQCAVWCILHVNPNTDKMRGHLGTELGNKASDIFHVVKNRDMSGGDPTYTVTHKDSRHRDIPDWTFIINNEISRLGIPEIVGAQKMREQQRDDLEDEEFLRELFGEVLRGKRLNTRQLLEELRTRRNFGTTKAKNAIDNAVAKFIISAERPGGKTIFYVFCENQEQTLPGICPF